MRKMSKFIRLALVLLTLGACSQKQPAEVEPVPDTVYTNSLIGGWGYDEETSLCAMIIGEDSVTFTHLLNTYRYQATDDSIIVFGHENDTFFTWRYTLWHDTLRLVQYGGQRNTWTSTTLPRCSD